MHHGVYSYAEMLACGRFEFPIQPIRLFERLSWCYTALRSRSKLYESLNYCRSLSYIIPAYSIRICLSLKAIQINNSKSKLS